MGININRNNLTHKTRS